MAVKLILLFALLLKANTASSASGPRDETIKRSTNSIYTRHNVRVHYMYDPNKYFPKRWLRPPIMARGMQISNKEAGRAIIQINTFLLTYPNKLIRNNLANIYLCKKIIFYGKNYGATNSGDSLYIANNGLRDGITDQFILETLHSEFSSILMRNYAFPHSDWLRIN